MITNNFIIYVKGKNYYRKMKAITKDFKSMDPNFPNV